MKTIYARNDRSDVKIHGWCQRLPEIEFYCGRRKNAEIEGDAWAAAELEKTELNIYLGVVRFSFILWVGPLSPNWHYVSYFFLLQIFVFLDAKKVLNTIIYFFVFWWITVIYTK
jgi:hypothetical protein